MPWPWLGAVVLPNNAHMVCVVGLGALCMYVYVAGGWVGGV